MINKPINFIVKIGFLIMISIGVFLRLLYLGQIPIGLNADEASIGYEAYSLLKTGADRWGIKLPPYFLSFGSGQNTLYAYLSVPFLYFFDLSQTSIRLLSAILGICTVPLVYLFSRILFKNWYVVVACTLLYLFDPYLFISSRWALEYNILPFFIIVSLLLLTHSFECISNNQSLTASQKLVILFSFPSLALIIYCYASALFIVPIFGLAILLYFKKEIWQEKKLFGVSILLFLVVISPFLLFILKNHILKSTLSIEQYLPFEIPQMLSNREEVYKGIGKNLAIIKKNIIFVFSGFKEFDRAFNTTKFYMPHLFLWFGCLGLVYVGGVLGFKNIKIIFEGSKSKFAVLFFWSIACFIPFLFFEMNLNRSVHLQAVVPILSMIGLYGLFENIVELKFKKYLLVGFIGLFLIQSILFYGEYFSRFKGYDQFTTDFDQALIVANKNKLEGENIAITSQLVFNYLFVGFYQKYSPSQFHQTLKADFTHPNVAVNAIEGYYFLGDIANEGYYLNVDVFEEIKSEKSFITILKGNETLDNYNIADNSLINRALYTENSVGKVGDWTVTRFTKK